MCRYRYEIHHNDSVNRWWLTDVKKTPYDSPNKAFSADINLGEGYVQIVYPVREAFLKDNLISKVEEYKGEYSNLYFPFENNRVEYSSFYSSPLILSCYGITDIFMEEDYQADFEICTCGGVKLWLNGQQIEHFTPYTRNVQSKKSLSVPFKKGINTLKVYFDELAERDVFFYFDLRYKGAKPLHGEVAVSLAPEIIKRNEEILKSCFVTQNMYEENNLTIGYDGSLLLEDIKVLISTDKGKEKKVFELKKINNSLFIKDLVPFEPETYKLYLEIQCEDIKIKRELFTSFYPKELKQTKIDKDINKRKKEALRIIAKIGKKNINKTIAILETEGKMTEEAKECYEISLSYLKDKKDCADFYFPVFIKMLTHYKDYLSEKEKEELVLAILDFRYWIDEPGNDVMWYFSENHALLFHTLQYLAGFMFKDKTFTASGRKGIEQYNYGRERLLKWFEIFFLYGYAEWNSITYIPIDLIAFFTLLEQAPDNDIKEKAKNGLDYSFKILAYNNYKGLISASYGRAYEDYLKVRELSETSFLEWVTAGKGFAHCRNRVTALYATSDYAPPNFYDDVEFKENEGIIIKSIQGFNKVNTYNYMCKDYCISSVVNYRAFEKGHQQHLQNIALGDRNVQFYINHPGERPYSGESRPSYWAGNGVMPLIHQDKDLQLMIYRLNQDSLVQYIHAYAEINLFDEYFLEDNWFFARVDSAYLATYFSKGFEITQKGANTNKEIISKGLEHKVIIRCGNKDSFTDFKDFINKVKGSKIKCDNDSFYFNDPVYGSYSILSDNSLEHNGKKVDYQMTFNYKLEKVKRS